MSGPMTCCFCDQKVTDEHDGVHPGLHHFNCPRCSRYILDEDAFLELAAHPLKPRQKANASGWIRAFGGRPLIQLEQLEFFIHRLPTPSAGERAEKLMIYLGKKFPDLNTMDIVRMDDMDLAAEAWAINEEEVQYLLVKYLDETLGFLQCTQYAGREIRVTILPRGWVFLDGLRSPNQSSQHGFIAMWFDDATQTLRQRGLMAGVEAAGYKPFLIDQHPTNEHVMDEVLAAIRRSRFVVADFTGARHNVYYEAGFAQGLNIPVVRTCRKSEINQVTFDVNHYPFILWEDAALDAFAAKLKNHIEATIGRGPLGVASNLALPV